MTQETPPAAPAKTTTTITLELPIKRGDQVIDTITLRKPRSGELRGVKLLDLLQMDATALHVVLPRITSPILTTNDVAALDPADLLQLGTEVSGFFMTRAATEAAGLSA